MLEAIGPPNPVAELADIGAAQRGEPFAPEAGLDVRLPDGFVGLHAGEVGSVPVMPFAVQIGEGYGFGALDLALDVGVALLGIGGGQDIARLLACIA